MLAITNPQKENKMFSDKLQEIVNEYGMNEMIELTADRKLQAAIMVCYIDHNWDHFMDLFIDSSQLLKTAIRERCRAHADSTSTRIDNIIDGAIFTAPEFIGAIIKDFEGYWQDQVLPESVYMAREMRNCTGDCGICLKCRDVDQAMGE